jgi:hypothetical protein
VALFVTAGVGRPTPAIHFSSHRKLLADAPEAGRRAVDGIVVAASRPAEYLRPALQLGAQLKAPVIALCSHDARWDDVRAMAWAKDASCIGVDLVDRPAVRLPDLKTSRFTQATDGALGDLALKRNLGLVTGRLAGWQRILFLDDDIFGIDPDEVEQASAALDSCAAVGLRALSFPDNSVVCHAHRTGRKFQGVFVSGSALVVRVAEADSFFPEMYNEDWLFLAPLLDRRMVTAVGSVRQERYAPFAQPERARRQEFGDVLAEGLIGYLHSARLQQLPTAAYWRDFLVRRKRFITDAKQGCIKVAGHELEARDALRALKIARRTLNGLSAEVLVDYLDAWQADLATWRRYLRRLPRQRDPVQSLHWLGLEPRMTAPVTAAELLRQSDRTPAGRGKLLRLSGRRGSRPTPTPEHEDAGVAAAAGSSGRRVY